MTPKTSLVTVVTLALVAVPAAWGNGQSTAPPDAFERAVAAQQQSTPIVSPDAVDRALAAKSALQTPVVSPDAFERAAAARTTAGGSLVFENHRVTRPVNGDRRLVGDNYRDVPKAIVYPASVAGSDTGRELEWPQIAMGFGLGIVLALGLLLARRYTRIRPLVH